MYKRENGIYYSDFKTSDGKTVRRSLGTTSKKEAKRKENELRMEYEKARLTGSTNGALFEHGCVKWFELKQNKKTLNGDKIYIRFWLKHFKGRPLCFITADDIYTVMKNKTGILDGTRYHYIKFMRSLLRMCVDIGYLDKCPAIKIKQPALKRVRWLTQSEANTLIQCASEPFKQLIIFALATGLRRSNICHLKWEQIDMQRKVAWIHPDEAKAGKAIGIALNETAIGVLKKQLGKDTTFVFINSCGKPYRVDDNRAWRTALKKAGIENFRFHDLRHTWASWLIQSGVPLGVLQEMGGWESIEMVRRYAHLSPSHLTTHAQNIDGMLSFNTQLYTQQKIKGVV